MTDLKSTTILATVPAPVLPPKPRKKRKLKVIVIGPNGGGVRKTKTALAFGSVAAAAGYKIIYVCADRGIGSLSASLRAGGPNHVELLPEEEAPNYATTLVALAQSHDADLAIIDLGANEMLNSKSRRTIKAALRQLKALGHDTFVVLSLVPNKVGLDDDASHFARTMSGVAQIVLAFHGRDEGGELAAFNELKEDYPSVEVATDQLGILGLIAAAGVTPYDWCAAPKPGQKIAAAWTAHNLMLLAKQPIMAEILEGDLAVPVLASLAEHRPVLFYLNRNSSWQVRDECLAADAREIAAQRALLGLPADADAAAVLVAARALIAASAAMKEAHRTAKLAG